MSVIIVGGWERGVPAASEWLDAAEQSCERTACNWRLKPAEMRAVI